MITGAIITGLILTFFTFVSLSGFSFYVHPFFNNCLDLAQGMTQDEISERMKDFLNSSDYIVIENREGTYGWKKRLTYDNSLSIILENEPWYKLDQHPWRCEILFRNNLAIDITPFFD